MKTFSLLMIVMGSLTACLSANAEESYEPHPDSLPQEGVPQGKIEGPFTWKSKIYPGTVRDYWLYVPAQYDASQPACVFVLQDGLNHAKQNNISTVLDNLIHKKEIPVQIGIFINPGVVPAPHEGAQPRINRSYEYDSMGEAYAHFLLMEILPDVSKSYNLSDDHNDRAIGGASSGAICAFNVAWERPDAFRRVFSSIGTYVDLRGADVFPSLIRKFEPKPIRVFLQDGSGDLNLFAGSWWYANQSMLSALEFSGYDVNHAWGEGGHSTRHAAAIMPDALRWLWRDYPQPIKPGVAPQRRVDILIPGEDWQLVSEGHEFTEGPAINQQGELFFTDIPNSRIHKLAADGTVSIFVADSSQANGLMLGPDGKLYACQNGKQQIVRYDSDGNEEVVLTDAPANDLVMLADGTGYYTDPDNKKVWRFTSDGERTLVDEGIAQPNGIAVSPDQTILTVSDTAGRFTYSFQRQPDGSLAHKQTYGYLHVPGGGTWSGADGMTVDTEGRLYVTTVAGLQVLDQLGRANIILNPPQKSWLSNVVFGGPDLDMLYVTCGDKVYRRKVKAQGIKSWEPPIAPPKPRL